MFVYNEDVFVCVRDVKRLQPDLHQETVPRMNSDAMTERVLNGDIVVIVNIIVLTAPTSSTVVSH